MSTTARLLEETFLAILTAGVAPGVAVRRHNEASTLLLPAVVLAAEETGDWLGVKVAGRIARVCSLDLECRVADDGAGSAGALEALAGSLDGIIAAAAGNGTLLAGWTYLRIVESSKKYSFDGGARVLTATYELHALTAA